MTGRRVTAPSELERTRAYRDCLLAGRHPHVPRQPPPQPGQLAAPDASRTLPPRPESVKMARDFTASMLLRWGMLALCEQAELVVSELVTNALRHGLRGVSVMASQQPVRLRLLAQPPCLMCMVADPSREIPLRQDVDPDAETGRGLHVIESCSADWGWHLLDAGGKVVWALLGSPGQGVAGDCGRGDHVE